ncbi:hypothetical protein ACFV3R_06915 [Streptomyces sp. NPDC059740]|uniref:hypothetical protein n=1 Tax=Streptomyces sp. NPDC059740 TaxID=3346926 RepID=UPI00364F3474
MVTGERERLADVVAAALQVAADTGAAGRCTAEVRQTLAAVVGEVGARVTDDAELRGFSAGWQEAMALRPAEPRPAPKEHAGLPGHAGADGRVFPGGGQQAAAVPGPGARPRVS